MPDKFNRPTNLADALYHDVLCGDIERVRTVVRETPELVDGNAVISGAWSHGGRRCGAQDDVIACLQLLVEGGADFSKLGPGTYDSAFKAFPRAARFLFAHGADARTADDDGTTGLHAMAAIGNRSAAEFLLDRGADVNAKTNAGETPLDVAIKLNLPRMVRSLRKRGGQPGQPNHNAEAFKPQATFVDRRDGRVQGEVAWYRADRGYGYLRDHGMNQDGIHGELFFDRDSIVGDEPHSIEEETPVSFEIAHDEFALHAVNVTFGRTIEDFEDATQPFVGDFSSPDLSDEWRVEGVPTVNDGVLRFAPSHNEQLVTNRFAFTDFVLTVDVRIISETACIIVRWVSPNEYYVVQVGVNPDEPDSDKVAWFHAFSPKHCGWRCDDLAGGRKPVEDRWYRLRLKAVGFELTLSLHDIDDAGNLGDALIEQLQWSDVDKLFSRGAVGFWECPGHGCPGEQAEFRNLLVTPSWKGQ